MSAVATARPWMGIVEKYQAPHTARAIGQVCSSILPFLLVWALMAISLRVHYGLTLLLALAGAEPVPAGQEFTYTVRAQGRLLTKEEFDAIVMRANIDGSIVRLKDVARVELGSQSYSMIGRMNGKPAAVIAIYQLPGSNAIDAMDRATKLMEELKQRFPADLDYVTSLDTTLSVREGINEIVHTLFESLVLVIIVVYIFLQGWRATLIPLLAVPVSLVGTFMLFPMLGFSINTLSLFGLVLAIGLVVDAAIVVVVTSRCRHRLPIGSQRSRRTLVRFSASTTGVPPGPAAASMPAAWSTGPMSTNRMLC